MNADALKKLKDRARGRQAQVESRRRDPRYLRVVGRLVSERLLIAPHVPPARAKPTLDEALWVGEEVEPRVLELLPVIVLRRPKLLLLPRELPDDLALVLRELRRGKAATPFRGVPPEKYAYWVERIGRGHQPRRHSVLRTHRFTGEDLKALEELKERWQVDETSALRKAIALAIGEK